MATKKSSRRSSRGKKNGKGAARRRLRMQYDDDGMLVDRHVIIEPPEIPDPTEQEKSIYGALGESFVLGDDAAKAIARFEKDVVMPRYRTNDESEEEFRKEEMEMICQHLGRLHMIKTILPFYGLEAYEKEIMSYFVDKAFGIEGSPRVSRNNRPSTQVFHGNDEQYLEHMAMTRDND